MNTFIRYLFVIYSFFITHSATLSVSGGKIMHGARGLSPDRTRNTVYVYVYVYTVHR